MIQPIAVADIGGTHTRFALADVAEGRVISVGEPLTLRTADFDCFEGAWAEFGRSMGAELPETLSIAFAGSTDGATLKLTNSRWVIRPESMAANLGLSEVRIINDFGAVAHAVAQFGPEQFEHCCGPEVPIPGKGVVTIIGPGTGLGVAQLLRSPGGYIVIETEGGHIDFAPLDAMEDRILAELRLAYGRVSVERVVSGSGLANIYRAMSAIEGKAASQMADMAVWQSALDRSDDVAVAALDRFFLSLGSVAGDLALAHGSSAVVIAGGLAHRVKKQLAASGLVERFVAKGRFRDRMEAISVKLLDHPQPGLYGAAAAFAKEHQ